MERPKERKEGVTFQAKKNPLWSDGQAIGPTTEKGNN